jgi:GT2 family glycosyltransferase/glycosyltransferase involved in cell wall biosynthesis
VNPLRASIIISSWNGRHLLETCLPRVLRAVAREGGDHEVIVVDDASTDDTVEYVRAEFPEVRLIALERNLRFAGANNAAAREAKGDVLVFLNNDMQVADDFLGPLLRHFDDPSIFAATARLEMQPRWVAGGLVQETGLVRGRFEDGFFVLTHEKVENLTPRLSEGLPSSPDAPSPRAERGKGGEVSVLYAGGGSSAMRRDRFFELGGFDRLFRPFYFEDLDVSYRAQKAGWRIVFEPRSRMVHAHRQTNSPENFPGNYVDLMFGKNSLLFTWKVLTDRALLGQHFRALWRGLMGVGQERDPAPARAHGHAPLQFLRAAAQLPELLASRQRARKGIALSDGEVLARIAAPPGEEVIEAGSIPYGSTGTGKRVLVVGFAPLPFEKERRLGALCFRTWHIAQALLAAGHEVTLVAVRTAGAYERENDRPPALRFQGDHFTYYSIQHAVFEDGALLQSIADRAQPEAIVTVHAYPAWIASRLNSQAPLWADLNGSAMTEAQARAAVTGDESAISEAWKWERAALARADAFSVVSTRQKYALIGELAAVGRLKGSSYGQDPVEYMPNAIEPRPYRHTRTVLRGRLVGERDFVVLWAGGYNTWTDVDTLFTGLTAAMREEPRLKFVSLGGAMPGRDEATFYRFRKLIEESEFSDRFVFAGWVPSEEVPNYYFESDTGINIDRFSYEMLIGCRYRILDMLRAGLPVVTTLGTEISHIVEQERLGATFAPGDAEGLKNCVLGLARDESRRKRCAERARDYVVKHRLVADVMKPLVAWAQDPKPSPDRLPLPEVAQVPSLRSPSASPAPRQVLGIVSDLLAKALIRRRGVAPWGLDMESLDRLLVIRAGALGVTQQVLLRSRERWPSVMVAVVAPELLAAETRYETGAEVTPAPAAEACGYTVSKQTVDRIRETRFDAVIVAGEGNRRAELLALLARAGRRIEVRDDGAAHVLRFAPYKPLMLLAQALLSALEKLTLTALVGIVWGSITAEGWVWGVRQKGKGKTRAAGVGSKTKGKGEKAKPD